MTTVDFLTSALFFTGVYAIYKSLQRLNEASPSTTVSDSIIEMKGFKWWAPAGLVYGLLALVSAFMMVQYDKTKEYDATVDYWKRQVNMLKQENEFLKVSGKDTLFLTEVKQFEAKPLWGGRVLVVYKHDQSIDTKSSLTFNGATIVNSPNNLVEFRVGDRFLIKVDSSTMWGVNVLSEKSSTYADKGSVTLQFFRH